jgi:hypothetical protein
MKFMILVKANPNIERALDAMSTSAMTEAMARMNEFTTSCERPA